MQRCLDALIDDPLGSTRDAEREVTKERRPSGRDPKQIGDALGVLRERALARLPGIERVGDEVKAIEINRKRERIHHAATRALADIGRLGVCRISQNCDAPDRPALELDQLERVIAAVRAEPIDQIGEMRERPIDSILSTGTRFAASSRSSMVSAM